MQFEEIIQLLMRKQGLSKVTDVPKYLGLSTSGFYAIRSGEGGLKESTVGKLMKGTGLSAVEIVAAWQADHARDPEVKKSWQAWRDRVAVAIFSTGIALLFLMPSEAYAANASDSLYIMRTSRWTDGAAPLGTLRPIYSLSTVATHQ